MDKSKDGFKTISSDHHFKPYGILNPIVKVESMLVISRKGWVLYTEHKESPYLEKLKANLQET